MRIAAKTEYACIAMLELASRYGATEPIRVRDIADAHGIPSRFLVQILLQLKAAGFVSSTRGAAGGYRLIRDPEEITLAEVMAVSEGPATARASNVPNETPMTRTLLGAWQEATSAHQGVLSSLTLADLLQRAAGSSEMMYYI
jgi:Rrf2 family protein